MKRLFLMLVVLSFSVACSDDGTDSPDNKPKDTIVIPDNTPAPTFTESGGSSSFRFTANSAWTADVSATRAVGWCSISPTSGGKGEVNLSIATEPNDTPDERNATINLRSGTTTKSISVTQKQKDALTVSSAKIELEAAGGTATVEIKANISFEYEIGADCADWVTYSGTRAMQTSRLEFKVAENEDTAVREGTITIRSSEGAETVKIYQSGADPVLVLTQKDYTVPSAGETIKIEIKSNVEYEVTMPQAEWIKESSTRAMSTHTCYFEISPNEEYDGRNAEIVFTSKTNNLTQKVTVTQLQKNAIIVGDSYTASAKGEEIEVNLQSNVDFTVVISDDAKTWIERLPETRGLKPYTVRFKIAKNDTGEKRTGTIDFLSGDTNSAVRIEQSGDIVAVIPDPAFRDYLLQAGYIAAKEGDYILTEAGKKANKIDCNERGIVSMEGVQYFAELDSLFCGSNNLTSLDVSQNPKLLLLACDRNQLITLDISTCPNIQEVYCYENQLLSLKLPEYKDRLSILNCYGNKLTSLDLSEYKNMTLIWVSGVDLTELTVPKSTEHLTVQNSSLTSLDLSGCKSLRRFNGIGSKLTSLDLSDKSELESVDCQQNQLTTLNLSGCTSLRELYCNNNQLSSFDLSGCKDLIKLHAYKNQLKRLDLSDCSALTECFCSYNKLEYLNVSNCSLLEIFWCDENKLKTLDLSECVSLTRFGCWNNELTTLNISNCEKMTELQCYGNNLTSLIVPKSVQILDCNTTSLTSLNLSGCKSLSQFRCYNTKITQLNLNDCVALEAAYVGNNSNLISFEARKAELLKDLDLSSNPLLEVIRLAKIPEEHFYFSFRTSDKNIMIASRYEYLGPYINPPYGYRSYLSTSYPLILVANKLHKGFMYDKIYYKTLFDNEPSSCLKNPVMDYDDMKALYEEWHW